MNNEIIKIEINKIEIPQNWNYENSIEKVKTFFYKWKNLTTEIMLELAIARKALSVIPKDRERTTSGTFVPVDKTWDNYCEEIGSERRVVNRWIQRYAESLAPQQEQEIKSLPLPEGKYNVIMIDPPWDIGSMILDKWESPLKDKYNTLNQEQLKGDKELPQGDFLKVEDFAGDDCVCFLWATLSTLPEALELLEDWGFTYHITITWDKGNGWSMNGFHRKTELILVGYKGILSNVIKQKGQYIPTLIQEKKTTHSTKPEIMYKLIEERTIGDKIEMFARKKRIGWNSWGNEI
jgi:N6-adenosine-specific RNA methylase IME4